MSAAATLDLGHLWNVSLDRVLSTVGSPTQRQWLRATQPVGFSDDTVVLAAPHAFAREWLDTRCGDRIRDALSDTADRPLTVVITVQPRPEPLDTQGHHRPDATQTDAAPSVGDHPRRSATDPNHDEHRPLAATSSDQTGPAHPPATGDRPIVTSMRDRMPEPAQDWTRYANTDDRELQAPGRPSGPTVNLPEPRQPDQNPATETRLNPKYMFDDFVIGSSNRFAHAAATAVAEAPAKSYNPLFIYGGAGLGKTHLLHAIGHYVRSLYPRLAVRYVTTEQFTNEFINGIRHDRITSFQQTYRQVDVLLIDDIQFLERAERTQEEFFHTFNALHNAEKQIVISSDRPPKQIAQLEDRLRSRFEWGLMTDVQPPDLETRIAILRKKCETDRLGVDPDVLQLIASKVQSNIRELEGALIRVSAFASLQRSSADSEMAETVLKDLFPDDREQEVSVQVIMDEVAEYFSLTVEDLCSPSRSRQLVSARQIAMYLTRELTELSLPRIGKAFGGRDHTTVMHAKSKIAGLMQERRTIYNQVQELTNRIKTRARRP